jgi:hypothetical protein
MLTTNLQFELDTPVYEMLMFRWIAEDDSFEARIKIIDKSKYNPNYPSEVSYKHITLYLEENKDAPENAYQSPSVLYYMGPNGIEWASSHIRKFKGIPEGSRMCHQCKYDEYIWKQVESEKLPKSTHYFYNWAVWDAYLQYRIVEASSENLVSRILENRRRNPEYNIVYESDTEPETDDSTP